MDWTVSSTKGCIDSLSFEGSAGVAKVSARKSAVHRRSSRCDVGAMMGKMPLITEG